MKKSTDYSANSVIEVLPRAYAKHKMITDAQGRPADFMYLQVNSAFERITGLDRRAVIGKRVSEVIPEIVNDGYSWMRTFGKIANRAEGSSIAFEQYSGLFGKWIEVIAYSDEPGYVTILFEDITERKKTIEALRRQNNKMTLVLEVSHAVAAEKDSDALLQVILEGLVKLTDMDTAAIYLMKEDKLTLEAVYPSFPEPFPEHLRIADLENHPHIAKAFSTKKPVVLPDAKKSELTPEEKELCELRNLRSILYVPLLYQEECIGVMIPSRVDQVYEFADEIIELCIILSGQAALSIIEARRTEEKNRYIDKIEKINRDLETTEETLRKSEKNLADILRYAEAVAFVTTDADKNHPRILDFSPGAEKIFGYSKEEVLGKNVKILHTEEDKKKIPQVMTSLADKQPGFSGETMLVRKNGEHFPALFTSHPLFDDNGNMWGTIGVSFDITDQKQAEEEKSSLEKQLAQSQKMETIGQLAGGIAHDFNNMLSVILGYSDMLMEELSENDQVAKGLQQIHGAAERSAGLTRQLLAFARQQTVEPKVIELNETVYNMLHMLRRLIGEEIELTWSPGADLGKVLIDPSQIDQVLVNLCVNAREAIAATGKIIIETCQVTLGGEYVKHHPEGTPGDYIMVAVSDDGCGMDSEILSHCMEPFFTTKDPGNGTGLGLPTVFGIVKQNNGLIDMYSEPGQGTTVKLYLPVADEKHQRETRKGQRAAKKQGNEKILLVDDDEMTRTVTADMLKQLGYTVHMAGLPQNALALSREFGDFSLLVTDVVMPEMNGKKLFETLKKEHPNLQCLYMSGYTSNVIVHRGIVDEGIAFLQKPFTKHDLAKKIRQVLDA